MVKQIKLKTLNPEDVFLEIVRNSTGTIKEMFDLYGINEKLTTEIISR